MPSKYPQSTRSDFRFSEYPRARFILEFGIAGSVEKDDNQVRQLPGKYGTYLRDFGHTARTT